jgi:2-keto-4-pentenoate hydratase/2-oxohepta-3-ene-1,7-dioic acid hydratase in catechol pathway
MKLARFTHEGTTRLGKVIESQVIDLTSAVDGETSMRRLLERLPELRESLEAYAGPAFDLSTVKLEAPINDPQKFLAIGLNYQAHAVESAAAGIMAPKTQMWFNKQVSCIAGPADDIVLPAVSDQLDYEAELAYVIGTKCRHVKAADFASVIAGYLVSNDVTVRDWQHRVPTWTLGKSFDTHGPLGPWITTADEIANPEDLEIKLTVDGKVRQHARTNDLIFNIAAQIEYLTTVMTLYPGDIIATGTPSGVAAVDQNWLKPGQVCRVEIEGLGAIENRIVNEA